MSNVPDAEKLQDRMSRVPTEKELEKLLESKKLVLTAIRRDIEIKDGKRFMRNLRKEANRQRAMQTAQRLEIQGRSIEHVPYEPSIREEIDLADSFEITEE